jgi:hypothetical protein
LYAAAADSACGDDVAVSDDDDDRCTWSADGDPRLPSRPPTPARPIGLPTIPPPPGPPPTSKGESRDGVELGDTFTFREEEERPPPPPDDDDEEPLPP